MTNIKKFDACETAWCPGCGNFAILKAVKQALAELGKEPHQVLMCSGIGQAAKTPHYINVNGFNGLHGRAIPPAFAAKIANKDLTVIVESGDGDTYGEGGNHFLHNMRRNIDIAHFVHNNQIYGLTKGQGSPTTDLGDKTKLQTEGVTTTPLYPLALAMISGAPFVARGFAGEVEHLVELMKAAITYPGYALVDILQPCVSFNKTNTFKWYKDRVYALGSGYKTSDFEMALKTARKWGDDIPLGVIYKQTPPPSTYIDRLDHILAGQPLVDRPIIPLDMKRLMDDFV